MEFPAALQDLLDPILERVAELERINAEQAKVIDEQAKELQILQDQNAEPRKACFGPRSERIDPDQLGLFSGKVAEQETPKVSSKAAETVVAGYAHKSKCNGREPFPPHLERRRIVCDLEEHEKACPTCDAGLQHVGEEIYERGEFIPAKVVVNQYVKQKYACPAGHHMRTASAPSSLVDKCKFEPSVYAHVATATYMDHVPLHRMSGIFKRSGINIRKQTMWDMLCRIDEVAAQPILSQMQSEFREEEVLQWDGTPVIVRIEHESKGAGGKSKKNTRQGHIWVWITPGRKKVICTFTTTRGRDGPIQFLGYWSGVGVMDGAADFDPVVERNGIIRAGCYSHLRRKTLAAVERGSSQAKRILRLVQNLFRAERCIARWIEKWDLSPEDALELRRRFRDRISRRIVAYLFAEAEQLLQMGSVLPRSALGTALTYLTNQKKTLEIFLDEPRIPIHNNDAEITIRHVAIGRKNWQVFGSPKGGEVASRLYSLMLSCKAIGVDPEEYLKDVISRISSTPMSRISELTPWAWAEARKQAELTEAK